MTIKCHNCGYPNPSGRNDCFKCAESLFVRPPVAVPPVTPNPHLQPQATIGMITPDLRTMFSEKYPALRMLASFYLFVAYFSSISIAIFGVIYLIAGANLYTSMAGTQRIVVAIAYYAVFVVSLVLAVGAWVQFMALSESISVVVDIADDIHSIRSNP